jgi:hypothetical protein
MVPHVPRPGIRPQFPKIKAHLKSYVLGPTTWQTEDLPRLRRYAESGPFSFRYAPELSDNTFTSFDAATAFAHVAVAMKWKATQMALDGRSGWLNPWLESVAYGYWQLRMSCRFQTRVLHDYESGKRPQYLGFLFLHQMGATVANSLSLGWTDWAIDLARRAHWWLDHDGFNDADDIWHRRTQHFILRLIGNWQGWPQRKGPSCAFDEPIFNALVEHWRTSDPDDLAPLLLAACDRHTHQARPDSNRAFFDLPRPGMEYDPFEILAVLKLRDMHGLPNPTLDHPLMNTPLGQLPPSVPPYSDELLEGVLARARQEFPDL